MTDEMMNLRTLVEKAPDADILREIGGAIDGVAYRKAEMDVLKRRDADLLFKIGLLRGGGCAAFFGVSRHPCHSGSDRKP